MNFWGKLRYMYLNGLVMGSAKYYIYQYYDFIIFFSKMMNLGFEKGWPVALEAMTGSRTMSIASMKNYLAPLFDYIDKELDDNGEVPGFGGTFSSELSHV